MTTGATNDMKEATSWARRMVTVYGFNEANGLLYTEDTRTLSPETQRLIDVEVRQILEESYGPPLRESAASVRLSTPHFSPIIEAEAPTR